MKLSFVLFLLAAAVVPCSASTRADPNLEMNADGEIQITPEGNVSDYRLQSQLAPAVASLVDQQVRKWHFVPVLVDGKAVVAKSAMHLQLTAVPLGDEKYQLEVGDVRFGEPKAQSHLTPPRYPELAIHARVGAKVLLYIKLDDNGKVIDAQVYQTSLDARASSEMEAEKYRKMFEAASMHAALTWQYDLTETINGKKVGTVAMVPFVYSLKGGGLQPVKDGQWKAYLPGPVHEVPWAPVAKSLSATALANLGDGEARSLDSRFQLRDDVSSERLSSSLMIDRSRRPHTSVNYSNPSLKISFKQPATDRVRVSASM